jgi:SMI1 / KNR4 family (SUKH-1)
VTYSRFRHLAVERAKPAPTESQLAAIEELLGARLPPSFRDFLSVANGGYLEYVIDVSMSNGKKEPLSFCAIFSADEGTFCDETFVGEILLAISEWYRGLAPHDRDMVGRALALAPHGAVFGLFAILDGSSRIDDEPTPADFKLRYEGQDGRSLICGDLHELLNSETWYR